MAIPRPVLLLLYEVFNTVFDHLLYPVVELWFGSQLGPKGILVGWAVMATFAVLICATLYYLYKRKGLDLVGVGYFEDLPTKLNKNRIERFLARQLARAKKNDPRTFLMLILNLDPYLITVFYERDRYRGTRECDWLVFWLVVICANLWWGFRSAIIAAVFLYILSLWNVLPEGAFFLLVLVVASFCYASPNPFLVEPEKESPPQETAASDFSAF